MKIKNASWLAGLGLVFCAKSAVAFVTPACDDRELLRHQMAASASNLAHVNATRTAEGGTYKKQIAVRHRDGRCEILSQNVTKLVKDPGNPDADAEGFVKIPDINVIEETKALNRARDELKKIKASQSANEYQIDVD